LAQRQHSGLQEFTAGAAIHRALERLQSIYLTFNLPAAPWIGDSVADGGFITPKGLRKALQSVDARLLGIDDSSRQSLRRVTTKECPKLKRQSAHQTEARHGILQHVEHEQLLLTEHGAGLHANPRRDES
jgi:hypothetical protein